jgi:murein L,D-transpeptidase YcbB/YkuD
MLANKGKDLSKFEPVNRQYNFLKDELLKYYEMQKTGNWNTIRLPKKSLKLHDTAQVIMTIKKNLFLAGDLIEKDSTNVFNESLETAIKSFERRHGLKEDGIITMAMINEMNKPILERLRQILINMERIRWMPVQPETDYLLVNIPEFKLHVYEKGEFSFNMNVVVGTALNNTVVFSASLRYIVFSPYWNVPSGILKKEILPAIQRNPNYLAENHMEWYGDAVRQKPGPWNALGLVKFLFPNNYSIYLHDTPSKSLFSLDKRTFSHGCIRVAEPFRLTKFLLRNEPPWDSLKIMKAMRLGSERTVTLKETTPVVIGYFTAWVDRDGKLNFRDDIYGHDKKMKAHLFSKQEQ